MLFFSRVIVRFFNNVRDEEIMERMRNGVDEANHDEIMDELTEYGQTPYS